MQTQRQRFADLLQGMKDDITEDDRMACVEATGFSITTISGYINGKGKNNDTSAVLIKFFKERIAARDRIALGELPLETKKPEEVLSG